MKAENQNKYVYIVISQTGTILSRILKAFTHREYNHASISLKDDLSVMYSFGRKHPYNPFLGRFVTESPDFGTFKRFANTKILLLKVYMGDEEYQCLSSLLNSMLENSRDYKYNYLGLYCAAVNICHKSPNRYYCSEFVKELLVRSNVTGAKELKNIVHPMSFIGLPNTDTVYRGKLRDYKYVEKVIF